MSQPVATIGIPRHPACNHDAYCLLIRHGQQVKKVVRVDPDCILFVTLAGRPRTCWMFRSSREQLMVKFADGFAAEPPPGFPPAQPEPEPAAAPDPAPQPESD